ncbi:MAG: O-antigen ligase family protein [Bdellovibrio sp.]|nr:O-antigen ligase family protein [Bdellovibrio sp.]
MFGIAQKMGCYPSDFIERVDSLLGNPIFFAVYTGLCFFIALFFFVASANIKKNRFLKYFYLAACVLNLVSIYLTQTRSVILASIAGLIAVGLYYGFTLRKAQFVICLLKKLVTVTFTSFLIVTALNFYVSQNQDLMDRLASSSFEDASAHERLLIWKQTFEAIKERPVLGWGQESFAYMAKYYLPGLWKQPGQDRAHNIILELLTTCGVVGLVSYAIFFIFLFTVLFKKSSLDLFPDQKAFLFGGLVFYLINNLFVFDNITSYILFFSAAAFINFIYIQQKLDIISTKEKFNKVLSYSFICISVTLATYSVCQSIENIRINISLKRAANSPNLFFVRLDGSLKLIIENILETKFFAHSEAVEQTMLLAMRAATQQADPKVRQYIFKVADAAIKKEILDDPGKTYFLYYSGDFYLKYGLVNQAEANYIEALRQSPNNQHTLIALGKLNASKNDYVKALSFFKKAAQLDPSFPEAQEIYANSLQAVQNKN